MTDDRSAIDALVQDWVIYRDSGDFDRLRDIWSADGRMNATWFRGSADDFIARSRAMFGGPTPAVLHTLGGTTVDVAGVRALSQSKMSIASRASVHGIACEITCHGRFYDMWQKNGGRWQLEERAVIYERDRLDPLDGAPFPALDPARLERFPPGYRRLAYAQELGGATVDAGLPGLTGAAVDALYARGRAWLAGV